MSSIYPQLAETVIYESKNGDGILTPAIVLRTVDTTNADVIERWGPAPDGTLSGKGRPPELVAELEDDFHVDLLCHGLGGDYREFNIPKGTGPGTWRKATVTAQGAANVERTQADTQAAIAKAELLTAIAAAVPGILKLIEEDMA